MYCGTSLVCPGNAVPSSHHRRQSNVIRVLAPCQWLGSRDGWPIPCADCDLPSQVECADTVRSLFASPPALPRGVLVTAQPPQLLHHTPRLDPVDILHACAPLYPHAAMSDCCAHLLPPAHSRSSWWHASMPIPCCRNIHSISTTTCTTHAAHIDSLLFVCAVPLVMVCVPARHNVTAANQNPEAAGPGKVSSLRHGRCVDRENTQRSIVATSVCRPRTGMRERTAD